MVQIHGIAYIAIGVSVITISSFVGERYKVFFYLGFVFVFGGIGKLLYKWMTKEEKPSSHTHALHGGHHTTQRQGHHQRHPHQAQRQHHQVQHHFKVCRRCGTHSPARAHFCSHCGARV